jgi:hypothetical protein
VSDDEAAGEAQPSTGPPEGAAASEEAEPEKPDTSESGLPGAPANGETARPLADSRPVSDPQLEDVDPDDGSLGDEEREQGARAAFDARIDGFDTLLDGGSTGTRPRRPHGDRARASFGDTTSAGPDARIYQAGTQQFFSASEHTARPLVGALSVHFIQTLRGIYVKSPSFRELLDGFGRSPLQVLVGPSGQGRTTTALAAVAAHAAPRGSNLADKVHIIQTRGDAEAVDLSDLPSRSGLVLVLGEGEPVPGAAWFARANRSLAAPECGSVLVVVTGDAPRGQVDADLVYYAMPPLDRICERHLRVRLGPVLARELAAEPAVLAELRQYRSPAEARLLAKDLAEGHERGQSPAFIIANRDPSALIEQIDSQLTKDPAWQRAYLVASAVLDGISVGTVVREAARLADLFETDSENRDGDRGERFTGRMRTWSEGCVELGDTTEGSGRTVRVVHWRLGAKILEEVWQEHVGLRDAMLAWLKQLAVHPEVRVRVKGAQAVAKLAIYDFDVIRREVLRAWANDGGFRTRQAVAWALEALALTERGRFAPRVRALVREWVRGSNVRLEAAGVAAYGTFLGPEYPGEALRVMREVAAGRLIGAGSRDRIDRAERELANIVKSAALEMFAAGAQEQVVAELAKWTGTSMWRLRKCAAKCLVGLAKKEGGLLGWPVLMELAAENDRFRTDVSALWRNALAGENDPAAAWEALHRLILRAENAGQRWPVTDGTVTRDGLSAEAARFRDLTRRLLADIAGCDSPADGSSFSSLRFHIRLWEFRDRRRLALVPDWMR